MSHTTKLDVGHLGARVHRARHYGANGCAYRDPLTLEDVSRSLSVLGWQASRDWLEALELGRVTEQVPLRLVLALHRVLGCSLLWLLGEE